MIGLGIVYSAAGLLAKDPTEQTSITTRSGRVYDEISSVRVEPDGLKVFHAAGVARIPMEDLPDHLVEKYQFVDSSEAQRLRNARKLANQEAYREAMAERAKVANPKPSTAPVGPRYINEAQVKRYWVNAIPIPHPLDREIATKTRQRAAFISAVGEGQLDLEALLFAAKWNRTEAQRLGDTAATADFEDQVATISTAIAERERIAREDRRHRELVDALDRINDSLRSIDFSVQYGLFSRY